MPWQCREGGLWQGQHSPATGRAGGVGGGEGGGCSISSGSCGGGCSAGGTHRHSWTLRCGTSQCLLHKEHLHFVPVLQHQSRAKATVAPLLMAPSPVQVSRAAAVQRDSCSLLTKKYDEFLQ